MYMLVLIIFLELVLKFILMHSMKQSCSPYLIFINKYNQCININFIKFK